MRGGRRVCVRKHINNKSCKYRPVEGEGEAQESVLVYYRRRSFNAITLQPQTNDGRWLRGKKTKEVLSLFASKQAYVPLKRGVLQIVDCWLRLLWNGLKQKEGRGLGEFKSVTSFKQLSLRWEQNQ